MAPAKSPLSKDTELSIDVNPTGGLAHECPAGTICPRAMPLNAPGKNGRPAGKFNERAEASASESQPEKGDVPPAGICCYQSVSATQQTPCCVSAVKTVRGIIV